MTLPKLYYTLPQLARKWGKLEDDLLHMAALGELVLSVRHHSIKLKLLETHIKNAGYVQLGQNESKAILENGIKKGHKVDIAEWQGETVYLGNMNFVHDPSLFFIAESKPPILLNSTSDLFILHDEVARVESEYPDIAKGPYNQDHLHPEDRSTGVIKKIRDEGDDPFEPIEGWTNLEKKTNRSRNKIRELCPKILGHEIRKKDETDPHSMVWLFKFETLLLINPKPIKRKRRNR